MWRQNGQGLSDTFANGNRNNLTVTNSHMDSNASDGVSILLNGKNGDYNIDFFTGTYARTDYNQFVFDNNSIFDYSVLPIDHHPTVVNDVDNSTDTTVVEGQLAKFVASLSGVNGQAVTFDWATSDGTATVASGDRPSL